MHTHGEGLTLSLGSQGGSHSRQADYSSSGSCLEGHRPGRRPTPRVFATFSPLFRPRPQPPHRRPVPLRSTPPRRRPALSTPLDPDHYDYRAAVLWNAHAGAF
ncbi:replication initiator [Streptomyces sp. NPDC008159]|uniref:replication initiator n=1 Tax=Streptomyces sp. NPDC008159 TaxID=3364817 RepID=UPI0036EEE52C